MKSFKTRVNNLFEIVCSRAESTVMKLDIELWQIEPEFSHLELHSQKCEL